MEWLYELAQFLIEQYPVASIVLAGLGSLLMIAQIIVLVTPSKKDDRKLQDIKSHSIWGKVWDFLLSFAPLQKKKGKITLSKKK